MDNKSLIEKIASKRVLKPYEAILIQHLNHKNQIERASQIKKRINPYLSENYFPPLISEEQLKDLLIFRSELEGQAYDNYKWAANLLSNYDDGCVEFGYKGIALINELRHFRSESIINLLVKSRNNEPVVGSLYDYVEYSYVNQKRITYSELLGSFFSTFHFLIMVINDILTLNYYLDGLFEISDLRCLQFLKMWFTEPELSPEEKEEEEFFKSEMDENHSCYDKIFSLIFDQNHPEFITLMKQELETGHFSLAINFEENSINYVKNTIKSLNLIHIYSMCMEKIDVNNS